MKKGITRRGFFSSGAALSLLVGIKGPTKALGALDHSGVAFGFHGSGEDGMEPRTCEPYPRLSTGFPSLDSLSLYLRPSELTIVAGRPDTGKTSFVLNVAHDLAIERRIPVVYFGLEMSKELAVHRLLRLDCGVDLKHRRHPEVTTVDVDRLLSSTAKLLNAPLYIDDTPALSTLELMEKARSMQDACGVKLLIIDYVQLLRASDSRRYDRQSKEVTQICRELKGCAQELNIPILAVSSLPRTIEYRLDKRPFLADAAAAGCELHADNVLLLYRRGTYDPSTGDERLVDLMLVKHRRGTVGTATMRLLDDSGRFEDLAC